MKIKHPKTGEFNVKSVDEWIELITGIKQITPAMKVNMFQARSEKYPI